ncbi:MAG: NAD-dependent epimerase/dehydratase family protein [Deltaproteobacteria bacterium]|nr:MAG: NAD-dependent epimerase/dehydratase family protein [Deltaproteobacteria bacterium]
MDSVFITGATGFVGSYLCRTFVKEGFHVVALKRESSDVSALDDVQEHLTWVVGDVLEPALMEEAISSSTYVIHSAAMISFSPETRARMYQVNVEGTRNVVELCRKYQPKKLCFVGSSAGLGKPSKGFSIDEHIDTSKSLKNTHYAKTKFLAEQVVWEAIAEGLSAVIVNPPVVLGCGGWEQSSGRLIDYVWRGKTLYPSGIINVVDIRDLQDTIYQLTTGKHKSERFLVSAHHLSYKELFEKIAQRLGVPAPRRKLSKWVAEAAWRLEALRSKFTGSKPFITQENAQSTSSRYVYDSAKLVNALDFQFRSLDDTLSWVCEGFLAKERDT